MAEDESREMADSDAVDAAWPDGILAALPTLAERSGQSSLRPLSPSFSLALLDGALTADRTALPLAAFIAADVLTWSRPLDGVFIGGHRCAIGRLFPVPVMAGVAEQHRCIGMYAFRREVWLGFDTDPTAAALPPLDPADRASVWRHFSRQRWWPATILEERMNTI